MIKITLVALIFVGVLGHSNGALSPEAEATFKAESVKPAYVNAMKLWECRPGFKGISDSAKEELHKCRAKHPQKDNNEHAMCTKLCIWIGVGIINEDGTPHEEKIKVLAEELYSNQNSSDAKIKDWTECYKENSLKGAYNLEKHCEAVKPFHACVVKRQENACIVKPVTPKPT